MVGGLLVKAGVESGMVIEGFDVMEDGGTGGEGGEAVVVNQCVFETAKEALDKSVIVAVAFRAMEALRSC